MSEDDINISLELDIDKEANLPNVVHDFEERMVQDLREIGRQVDEISKEPKEIHKVVKLIAEQKKRIEELLASKDIITLGEFEGIKFEDIDYQLGDLFLELQQLLNPQATADELIDYRIDDDIPTQVWAGRGGQFDAEKITEAETRYDPEAKPIGGLWTSSMLEAAREYSNWSKWLTSFSPSWRKEYFTKLERRKGARIYTIRNEKDLDILLSEYELKDKELRSPIRGYLLDYDRMKEDIDAIRVTGGMQTDLGWDLESTYWLNPELRVGERGVTAPVSTSDIMDEQKEAEKIRDDLGIVVQAIVNMVQKVSPKEPKVRKVFIDKDVQLITEFVRNYQPQISDDIYPTELTTSLEDIASNRKISLLTEEGEMLSYSMNYLTSTLSKSVQTSEVAVPGESVMQLIEEKIQEINKEITFELGNIDINIEKRHEMSKKVKYLVREYFIKYTQQIFDVIQMLSKTE